MGSKDYIIYFSDNEDYDYENHAQKVWSDNTDEKLWYYVYDLVDYPEDATIERDLFSGKSFIEAVKLGFRLAQRGYDSIVVKRVPWEE